MSVQTKKRQSFSLAAPEAKEVLLVGEFTAWEQAPVPLKKAANGMWETTVSLEPGPHEYRFIVDGQWQNDPACRSRVPNGFGSENCICIVSAASKRKSPAK
jgi:1,4-alpha-glucan branching enzyme